MRNFPRRIKRAKKEPGENQTEGCAPGVEYNALIAKYIGISRTTHTSTGAELGRKNNTSTEKYSQSGPHTNMRPS